MKQGIVFINSNIELGMRWHVGWSPKFILDDGLNAASTPCRGSEISTINPPHASLDFY
jgi:hypothetical protein